MFNRTPPNPYVVGNPLTDQDGYGFYGRRDVYDFLLQKLNATVRPAILLHGHRRIGKTSILRQMPRFMPEDWKIVFYDVQGQAFDSLEEILYGIAYEIDEVLDLGGVDQEDITTSTFQNQFLPRVFEKLDGRKERLILLFDEFDVLDPEKSHDVFNYLRAWISTEQQVGYVFVVGRRPEHLSEIFRDLSTIVYPIGRLSQAETEKLIRQPAIDWLKYPDETVERIWQLTSGHPLATQLLCFELWPHWVEQGSVPRHAVDEILPDALKSGDNQLNQIYDGLNQAIQRLFLSAVADTANDNGVAQLDSVLSRLASYQVNIGANLNEVRSSLANWDILLDQGDSFRYSVDLVRRWVAKNRSLERMVHEAPLVSERAYRFYQIAEDLRLGLPGETEDERDASLQDSIVNYKRALQINPLLVAAQVGLAYALMESGEVEAALEASQKAYEVDPAQRDVLIEVHLRMGELLERQGDFEQALSSYNNLIDLGDSQRALTRRNRLFVQQAENLANQGRYEQALAMIEQADAPKRYQAIQKEWELYWQRQKNIIDNQVQVKDWDAALGSISEYLKLNPGDIRALTYQKETQDAAQTDWNNQAEQLLTVGQLEEALQLLEKAGNETRAKFVRRLIEQEEMIATIEALEAAGMWEQALSSLAAYENDFPQDEQTAGRRARLQKGYKVYLEGQINKLEAQGEIDEALVITEQYIKTFPSPEAEALRTRLKGARRIILVDRAKEAGRQGNYGQAISLLTKVDRLDLAKSVVTSGKRVEWSSRLYLKLALLVVLIIGLVALLIFSPATALSSGSNFWLNTLFLILVSGIIYLAVWIFFGDILMLFPTLLSRGGPSEISPEEAKKLEARVGNRSYRLMAFSHMLAFTLLFLVWEFIFFLYVFDKARLIYELGWGLLPVVMAEHSRIWLWLAGAALLGFFTGALLTFTTSTKNILNVDWDTVMGMGFIAVIPAIFLIFILPFLTHRWWGNFQIAHTLFLILGLLIIGFFGILAISELWPSESISKNSFSKEIAEAKAYLDVIPGIGEVKRNLLLDQFGSLYNIQQASVEELAAVPGISPKLARDIKSHLADQDFSEPETPEEDEP